MTGVRGAPPLHVAYLISRYPVISHAFILGEVRSLRKLGICVQVASINPPDRSEAHLTAEERDEAMSTFYVKSAGLRGVLVPHLATLIWQPLAYLKGVLFALRLGGADLIKLVFGLFYFVEAVMIGRWMTVRGLSYLHVHFATPAATVALLASRIFSITFSMTVHGPDEFYDTPGYRLPEKIGGARFVCCIGMYARSQLMKLSSPADWGKFEVVPLGVDPTVFTPAPISQDFSTFEVLCVGRLVPAKGQYILVAAIAHLVRTGRKVRLRVIGDGPDRSGREAAVMHYGLQGLWVMVVYRFGRWRYGLRSHLIRQPFSLLYKIMKIAVQISTGIDLPCELFVRTSCTAGS
jgi:colanic acid/amylovoran biosynthesis glycosyltransferase